MKKLILYGVLSVLMSLGSMGGLFAQDSVEPLEPGGVTCPAWGQVGGNCHITIQKYKQTQYGPAFCDYCEWTGYQADYCEPLSHGGCMSA